MSAIKRMTGVLLLVLAMFGGVATVNASAAVAAPQVVQQTGEQIGVQASWTCNWTATSRRVDASCVVRSGEVRLWGDCSNGGRYYTPYVGVGRWNLWVDCGGYRLLRFGFQSRG